MLYTIHTESHSKGQDTHSDTGRSVAVRVDVLGSCEKFGSHSLVKSDFG